MLVRLSRAIKIERFSHFLIDVFEEYAHFKFATMISLSQRLFAHVSAKTQNDLSFLYIIKDKSQYSVRGVAKIASPKTTAIIRLFVLQRLSSNIAISDLFGPQM